MSSARLTACAKWRTASRDSSDTSLFRMIALSWSVAMVCSARPSEPRLSQHSHWRSMPNSSALSCTSRSVSTSLRWLIIEVSCRACTPCASRLRARRRMSCAEAFSASTLVAERSAVLTLLRLCRCMANRSRSDTMPIATPSRVTGTWRMPWRDISSAASCAVCSLVSVRTGATMTSEMGVSSGNPASATRPSTS
ncbi:hypothetical protein D3C72_1675850 [compost metagenome]